MRIAETYTMSHHTGHASWASNIEPSVRTLTPLKWRSVLTVKPNFINPLLKTRSVMQERQGAEREVQCLLKIGILARDSQSVRHQQQMLVRRRGPTYRGQSHPNVPAVRSA